MKTTYQPLVRAFLLISIFLLLISIMNYAMKLFGIDEEEEIRKSCELEVIQGIISPKWCSKGVVFFNVSSLPKQTLYLPIGSIREEYDFYEYVKRGDSICRARDTMFVFKPNGERTKWLINCANYRPRYQPEGFGKPKTPSK